MQVKVDHAWAKEVGPGFGKVMVLGKDVPVVSSEVGARRERTSLLDTDSYKLKRRCVEKKMVEGIISSTKIDDVLAKFMAKNKVAYVILLNRVLNAENRAYVIGTVMRDIRLCRKYGVWVKIGSGAKKRGELRSAEVLISFLECLGLDRKSAKEGVL
jgi:RNase P/RNase MRP subunit p30